MTNTNSTANGAIRSVDRDVLTVLREQDCLGVDGLTKALAVTATAVRQRVDRLLEAGLIEREKIVSGRGRPTYKYRLSKQGLRRTSADVTRLAEAMWQEILSIPDQELRSRMIDSVAARLAAQMTSEMDEVGQASFESRMHQLSEALSSRQMEAAVKTPGDLPVLDIGTCPYPSLTELSDQREMCRLEEQMISQALGQTVKLSSCCLDGDDCCQFSTVNQNS